MRNTKKQDAEPASSGERQVPHNLYAERALLGSILLDNLAINYAIENVGKDDFYSRSHGLAFDAMVRISNAGRTIDLITVSEVLGTEGNLEKAGGAGYLSALTDGVPIGTMSGMSEYCRIVKEKATCRQLITLGEAIVQRGVAGVEDSATLLETAQTEVFELATKRTASGLLSARQIIKDGIGSLGKLFENGKTVTGIETGLADLDSLTCGLQPQEFVVIAGRPSAGKTALGLTIAGRAAVTDRKSVAFFSLEMSKEALLTRLICLVGRIDSHKLRTGFATKDDWTRATYALGEISNASLYVDDSPNSSVMQIGAKARRHKAEKGLDLVVVDYLQLLAAGGKFENRTQEVTFISKGLKALAKELKVPVVGLSQLRRPDQRAKAGQRPQISDLRESGSIEQDADVIVMIHVPKRKKEDPDEDTDSPGTETTLILGKQRNGPTGDVPVVFLKAYGKFENRAPDYGGFETTNERLPYND